MSMSNYKLPECSFVTTLESLLLPAENNTGKNSRIFLSNLTRSEYVISNYKVLLCRAVHRASTGR